MRLIFVVLTFIAALRQSKCLLAQDIDREAVSSKIQLARRAIESIHVAYSVRCEGFKDSFLEFVHLAPADAQLKGTWYGEHAKTAGGKFFHFSSQKSPKKDKDYSAIFSDGEYIFEQREGSSVLDVYRGNLTSYARFILPGEELYMELLGMDSARQDIGFTLHGYKDKEAYDILAILSNSSFQMKKQGAGNILLEKNGVESVTLDGDKDFAMLQMNRYLRGKPTSQVTNSEFEHVESKVWLPKKSSILYFDADGKEIARAVLTVTKLSLSPPASLFAPKTEQFKGYCDKTRGLNMVKMAPLGQMSLAEFLDSRIPAPEPTQRGFSQVIIYGLIFAVLLSALVFAVYFKRSSR